MSILDYADPVGWRFFVYGEDDAGDPLFSFWMVLDEDTMVCVYDRSGGHGMWLETVAESEYDGQQPSEEFEDVLYDVLGFGGQVSAERVHSLPNHERYFFQAIHGTIEQKGRASEELEAYLSDVAGVEVTVG